MNLIQAPSLRNYIVFNNAIATGYDLDKCLKGVEDLTKLKDIDNSKPWCDKLVACRIIECEAKYAIESYEMADIEFTRIYKNI